MVTIRSIRPTSAASCGSSRAGNTLSCDSTLNLTSSAPIVTNITAIVSVNITIGDSKPTLSEFTSVSTQTTTVSFSSSTAAQTAATASTTSTTFTSVGVAFIVLSLLALMLALALTIYLTRAHLLRQKTKGSCMYEPTGTADPEMVPATGWDQWVPSERLDISQYQTNPTEGYTPQAQYEDWHEPDVSEPFPQPHTPSIVQASLRRSSAAASVVTQ